MYFYIKGNLGKDHKRTENLEILNLNEKINNKKLLHIRKLSLQFLKSPKQILLSQDRLKKEIKYSNKENEEKDKNNICFICFTNEANSVIMECGHGGFFIINKLFLLIEFYFFFLIFSIKGLCYDCALESWKNIRECLLCRSVYN